MLKLGPLFEPLPQVIQLYSVERGRLFFGVKSHEPIINTYDRLSTWSRELFRFTAW